MNSSPFKFTNAYKSLLSIRAWNAHQEGTDSRNTCSNVRRETLIQIFFFLFFFFLTHPSILEKPWDGRCCARSHLADWELVWDMIAEHIFGFDLIQIQELDLAVLRPQELS